MISLIAAAGRNGVIGNKGKLPWRLPEDMKFFTRMTTGKAVVMGRRTFESVGRPLKDRVNIILTRDVNYQKEGCVVYQDIQKVVDDFRDKELMVIGGEEIYKLFLPHADKVYLTFIDSDFEGDTFFPKMEETEWELVGEEKGVKDDNNIYDYYFREYKRKK